VLNALDELEAVRRVVFGDLGDEPDVYADYDRCCETQHRMTRALAVLHAWVKEEIVR